MKRLLAVCAIVATVFAVPSTVAAAGITCSYNSSTHTVTVTAVGGPFTVYLSRDAQGRILLNSVWCQSTATVANTDKIIVNGDGGFQNLTVNIANGGFRPGFTDEPGTSDEIEFEVNLGGQPDSATEGLAIFGTTAVDKIDLGQNDAGTVRRVNLNAAEATGIDSDMSVKGIERATVYGDASDDVIRARGKAGTGPAAFALPLLVYGGHGNDTIKGGNAADGLFGEQGTDTVYGFGGADTLHLDDGAPGDVGYGGTGADAALTDAGDTFTD